MLKLTLFPLADPWFKKLPILSSMINNCFNSGLSSTATTALRSYWRLLFKLRKRSEKLCLISRQIRWPLIPGTRKISIKYCSSLVNSSAWARLSSSNFSCSGSGTISLIFSAYSAVSANSSRVDSASTTSGAGTRKEAIAMAVSLIYFYSRTLLAWGCEADFCFAASAFSYSALISSSLRQNISDRSPKSISVVASSSLFRSKSTNMVSLTLAFGNGCQIMEK